PWDPTAQQTQPGNAAFWYRTYFWLVWVGIAANCLFVLPLIFAPRWMLTFLGVSAAPVICAQMGGLLLGLISVFYIPAASKPVRYRAFAWLAVFPSRAAGVTFCAVAVIALGANDAFLLGVLLDLPFAVLQTIVLCAMMRREQAGKARL